MPDVPESIIEMPGDTAPPLPPGGLVTPPGGATPPLPPQSLPPQTVPPPPPPGVTAADFQTRAQKGQPGGYAELDGDGKLPGARLPEDPRYPKREESLYYGAGDPDGVPIGFNRYVDEDSGVIWKRDGESWIHAFTPAAREVYFVTDLPSAGTGSNGDLAVIYTDGTISGLAEKTGGAWAQVANNAVEVKKPTDLGVVSLVDHFAGGTTQVNNNTGIVGELGWLFSRVVGSTGSAEGISNGVQEKTFGVIQLTTGASIGNTVVRSRFRRE